MPLEFGLQISRFTWPGGADEIGPRSASIAPAAEEAGFTSLWVMDHFLQIPGVGREWEEMLDSYTTLGYLAAVTSTSPARRAGHRHHVPQPRASRQDRRDPRRALRRPGDVRARRGVVRAGAPAVRLGLPAAAPAVRDARGRARAAAVDVGRGSPAFHGRTIDVPEATCYPRPLQEHVPILVGGSRRTSDVAARRAVRRRVQPVRRAGHDPPQDRRAQAALRGGGPRPVRDHRHATLVRRLRVGRRARSAATESWRMRACRTRSCPCPTWRTRPPSSASRR